MVADFTDPEALTSNFPRFIAQVESVNPGLTVSELVWGATSAAGAGRDSVHGEGAARYEVTLDLDQALANASGTAFVPFGRAIATEVKAVGASTRITAHAWVTDAGRLARVELLPPGAGVGTLTMTLGSFGGAVHADPPPTSQIVDVLTLTPGGERENKNGGDADGG
jgi:hypothetical protein